MKISVIIPIFNADAYLDEAVASALAQAQTAEVVLVNDRSTDGSWAKCQDWVKKDSRVRALNNEGPRGAGPARNEGLKNSDCEFVAFLDADDYFLGARFDAEEVMFAKDERIDAILGSFRPSGENHQVLQHRFRSGDVLGPKVPGDRVTPEGLVFGGQSTLLVGVTIRRRLLDRVGHFDPALKQTQDSDLIFRMVLHGCVYSSTNPNPIVAHRRHKTNSTLDLPAVVYYRRLAAKKQFRISREARLPWKFLLLFLRRFIEHDYLWVFGKKHRHSRQIKFLLLPWFVYRIFSRSNPSFDPGREIEALCGEITPPR